MDMMEKVERLREKTGVSYTEAKAALEQCGGDLLDALCWLEQHGKTQLISASCSTRDRETPGAEQEQTREAPREPGAFQRGWRSLWEGLKDLIHKGNRNELVMTTRDGQKELGLPVTLFVLLTICFFWVMVALIVIALFFGNRFSFQGPDLGKENINEAMGRATDFAESIKSEFADKE